MLFLFLVLLSILLTAIIGFVLWNIGDDSLYNRDFLAQIAGLAMLVGSGVTAILYATAAYSWMAADYQAQIINREYGTNYTREEVFFASDVIDTIRELDRKRIELNGNLMRETKD